MGVSKPASIIHIQSQRPIVLVTLAFATGICISAFCRYYLFCGLATAGVLLVASAFIAYRGGRTELTFLLAQTAVVVGGMLTGLAHRDGYNVQDLRSLLSERAFPLSEPVMFEGRITEKVPLFGEDLETVVDLRRFRKKDKWMSCKGKGILRIATPESGRQDPLRKSLKQGTVLRAWAVWKVPQDFENPGSADRSGSLARRGIYLIGRVKSRRLIESVSPESSGPLTQMANSVRSRLEHILEPIRGDHNGQPAAILASLMIGDHSGLSDKTRSVFQNAGSFHILVVSGLHVAWITGAFLILSKLIGVPERIRYILAAIVVLLYAWIVGFQAGITRCLWVFLLYLVGRIIPRSSDSINILFTAALLLLVSHPDWLYEAGYQMSFISVTAILLTAVPIINGRLKPALRPLQNAGRPEVLFLESGFWHKFGRRLRTCCELRIEEISEIFPRGASAILFAACRLSATVILAIGSMLLLSIAVQLWIAPLLAFYFNRISWIAPLSNLVLVPIASCTLAAGILALALSDVAGIGQILVQFAGYAASLLLDLAEQITSVQGSWQRCPTPSVEWIIAGILTLFLWPLLKWKKSWIPLGYMFILITFIACGSFPIVVKSLRGLRNIIPAEGKRSGVKDQAALSMTFLDVGEGDSIVIFFPNHQLWILDAGGLRSASSGKDDFDYFDTGEAVVSRYLWHRWTGNPDRMILSHTDIDHAGGIPALLNNFKVRRLDYPLSFPDAILTGILETARNRNTRTNPIYAGMEEWIGEVQIRILHPRAYPVKPSSNDNSIVLALSFKRFSVLLTGDLEDKGESRLLSYPGNLHSLLLKVAHHGSRSATSSAFLGTVQPRWAFISAGRNNPFGHPSPEVLHRLALNDTRIYQTAEEGAVTFTTDGDAYEIRSHLNGLLEHGQFE